MQKQKKYSENSNLNKNCGFAGEGGIYPCMGGISNMFTFSYTRKFCKKPLMMYKYFENKIAEHLQDTRETVT